MALTAIHGFHALQIDFIRAYLHGKLREAIYMKVFDRLDEYFEEYPDAVKAHGYHKGSVIQLMNPLYGLRQAGAEWQREARSILRKFDLKRPCSSVDSQSCCVYR